MNRQLRSRARRRPERNHRRLLHVEPLEPRIVLSTCVGAPAGAPADVFGSLSGTIASPGGTESCDLNTTGYTLVGGATRIGFHVIGSGGFDPATVQISGGAATTIYQNANSAGGTESVIVAELGAAAYTLTVGGEAGSTGNFEMHIFLAGDVNGDRAADTDDVLPLRAAYGSSVGSPNYDEAADANRDGYVTTFDYIQWRRNLGDEVNTGPMFTSAPLTSATDGVVYTYNVTASDPDPGEVLTITAPTLPGWLGLTDHGDGTATLTGTPGAGDVGSNVVGLLVTDTGGATDTQNFSITVDPAGTPPVANNDVVNSGATGNVQMGSNGIGVTINGVVGGNVLDNDTGGGLNATAGASVSTNGGAVTMAANGDFTYNPPAGFEGVDTFTYEAVNGFGSDVGAVSITVSDMIWFIDETAPNGGDGRLTSPFDCLVGGGCFDAGAADEAGDNIFLADGNYNGGLALLNNQKLIGQGASGTLEGAAGITLAPGSDALPALNGSNPVLTTVAGDGIVLGSDNTVRGLTVDDTAGSGIVGTNFGTLSVSETAIDGNGQALDLDTGTLAATFDSVSSSGGTDGINIDNVSGSLTVSGTTISAAIADGIVVSNSGGASFDFGDVSLNSFGNGIDIAGNNPGASFTFDSLIVINAAGTGFWADNSGTVHINSTSASVDSTNGPALDITNTIGQTNGSNGWTFGSVSSSNSPTDGILFQDVGQSISLSDIDIDNAADEGIELNNVTGPTNTITGGRIDGAVTDRDGIFLTGVTGATTIQGTGAGTKFQITNIATGAGIGHHGIHSLNSGNLTVQFVDIDNVGQSGDEHGILIINPISGNRSFSITDNRFANIGDTTAIGAGSAIDLEVTTAAGYTGTLDIDITGNDINGNGLDFTTTGQAVSIDFSAPADGTLDANISNNDMDGVNEGITVLLQGNAGSGVNGRNVIQINDNTGDDFDNNGIELDVFPDTNGNNNSNTRAVISGNVLNAITNYTASGHDPDEGIEVEMRGSSGSPTLSIDITTNTIDSVSFAADERWDGNGITVGTAGSNVAFAPTLTADIHNNNVDKVEDAGILLLADESATVALRVTSNTLSAETDGMELDTENDPYTLQTFFSSNTANAWDLEENANAGSTWELGATAGNGSIGSTFTTPAGSATLEGILSSEGNTGVAGAFQDGATIAVVNEATISGANLLASGSQVHSGIATPLTQGDLNRVAGTAIDLWASSGITAAQRESLEQVRFVSFNLPAGHLGNSLPGLVEIDVDAAGRGWSLAPIVGDARVDLLTVVMHELGHVLGLGDTDHDGHDLMSGSLAAGDRRLPSSQLRVGRMAPGSSMGTATDALFDSQTTGLSGASIGSSLDLGRLGLESGRLLSAERLAESRASSSREAKERDDDELNVDDRTEWLDQLAANLAATAR